MIIPADTLAVQLKLDRVLAQVGKDFQFPVPRLLTHFTQRGLSIGFPLFKLPLGQAHLMHHPTGPLDIIQAWVEIEVTDQEGRIIFTSGKRDERNFIDPGAFLFKAEPVDRYGNLVDRHNLWEMVGVRYRRSLFPGFSDEAEFAFVCPSTSFSPDLVDLPFDDEDVQVDLPRGTGVERLDVVARLMYRKFDQFLLNYLEGGETDLTAPVTVMSEDRWSIQVGASGRQ